jgi:prevent-host-death family protein
MGGNAREPSTGHGEITTVDARGRLSELLNRAAYGHERVVLTRRGKPVAALVPVEDLELIRAAEDAEDLAAARAAIAEGGELIPLEVVVQRHGAER